MSQKLLPGRKTLFQRHCNSIFLKEVVTKKKTAQINMSQNEVSSYECFADSVYANSCKLLEIAGEEGCLSYSRNVIISAVENLEKSIVHFK